MGISYKITDWLPTSVKEVRARGWDELDVILFSGDAYVDHPSFGAAVIGRLLEAEGLRVAIVPQPNWRDDLRDFRKLGKPRLFFGVSAGSMDSMVNHYTANKRLRSDDAYTPGGKAGFRPDYAVTVYTLILKRLFPDTPVVIGGIEASLRRAAHYDYWSDSLKPSVLVDSGADLLTYGMGERVVLDIARAMGVDTAGMSVDEGVAAAVRAVRDLSLSIRIPQRLHEIGVREEDIPALAVAAFNDVCTGGNPRPTSVGDIEKLYRTAF